MADADGRDDQSSAGAVGSGPAVPVGEVGSEDGDPGPAAAPGDCGVAPEPEGEPPASVEPSEPSEPPASVEPPEPPESAAPAGAGDDGGATAVMVAGNGLTEALTAAVPTQSLPAAGEQRTARLPSSADMARWSGRAGLGTGTEEPAAGVDRTVVSQAPVRAPAPAPAQPGSGSDRTTFDQPDRDDRPAGITAATTVVALVLLAVLGIGVWLILNALLGDRRQSETPPPVVTTVASSPTPSPVEDEPQPPQEPSTAAPTSAGPMLVEIPSVRGKGRAEAERTLIALGLAVAVEQRDAGSAAAGTVLGTEPAEGTAVSAGSTVTLIVARIPSPSPSSRPPSSSRAPSPSVSGRVMPAR